MLDVGLAKTALLQAEVLACVSELANVLFCALAIHFIISFFSIKLSTASVFLHLHTTGVRAITPFFVVVFVCMSLIFSIHIFTNIGCCAV
jgi:hypothetical protein